MVKINPDNTNFKRLEELQKRKKQKEKEFLEQEQEKEKELQALKESKEKEITMVERHLEEAVADLVTNKQEEEELILDSEDVVVVPDETPALEETLRAQRRLLDEEDHESGPIYEINTSELEEIGNLYGAVRRELETGVPGAAVDKARDMIYHLQKKKDVYISEEAHHMIKRDRSDDGKHYVQRLGALVEMAEQRTGTGYQSKHPWED